MSEPTPNPNDPKPGSPASSSDGAQNPTPISPEELEAALFAESDPLTVAQAELAVLKAKSAELADQYLRAQADVQNARRRADDEITKARKFAIEAFAESLLPVADSLEAGLAIKDATVDQLREGEALNHLRQGVEATLRQLTSALERNKVIAINPQAGAKFDPHFHQAISVVPSEFDANTVVAVLQKGYSIADRVMRPALVTVCAPK